MQAGVFCFFTGSSGILISTGMCGSGRKKQCCAKYAYMCNFKSHFQQDFLAYCTGPVRVHLAMAYVGCSFDSFSVFLLSLKQQQNVFSCIHFPIWPYPPQNNEKNVFYTSKLYGLTGMTVSHNDTLYIYTVHHLPLRVSVNLFCLYHIV